MNLSSNKKIAILGIALLVLAGIIVVALKGMNVDLMLQQHKSMNIVIGKEFDIKVVEDICKEVFGNKNVSIRKIGTFADSVNINAVSISNEEKASLVSKINEKLEVSLVADSVEIITNSNVRLRDLIRPYVVPVCVSAIAIYAYIAIKYRKENILKVLGFMTGIILVTEIALASLIAIVRIPVSPVVVNLMLVVAVVEILAFMYKKENAPSEAKD